MTEFPYILPFTGISSETAASTLSKDKGFLCFRSRGAYGRYGNHTIIASNPKHTFSLSGGFVTVDGHTRIDTPIKAFTEFCKKLDELTYDNYLPFSAALSDTSVSKVQRR